MNYILWEFYANSEMLNWNKSSYISLAQKLFPDHSKELFPLRLVTPYLV
jgi:hypothetical protein